MILWRKLRDLPPKKQIWLWLAALMLLIPLYLHTSGISLRSAEQRFRRMEAAELLGPMEILGRIETGIGSRPRAILAADEHTAAVYLYGPGNELLLSKKREGDFTLLCAGYVGSADWFLSQEEPLPLILFDRCPKAVRAELTVEFEGVSWTAESVRDGSGWFRFDLVMPETQHQAFDALYVMTTQNRDTGIRCTVRCYGATGELIAEESR